MKELIINGHVIKSIWKSDKSNADKENNQVITSPKQAYRDPTAKLALGNILREERKIKRKKRQTAKQNRRW